MEFSEVVRARRSVRKFTSEDVPDSVMRQALEEALLAPNSSNMQPWEFFWIRSPEKRKAVIAACFGQPAAATAKELVVAVARRDTWKRNLGLMIGALNQHPNPPKSAVVYYQKIVPLMYRQGPLGLLGKLKGVALTAVGFFRPVPRGPYGFGPLFQMLVKTTALACENLMLSIVNQGYACCPMEGFDEKHIKKALNLGCESSVVMCIGIGRGDPTGVYGPRIRFDYNLFVKEV